MKSAFLFPKPPRGKKALYFVGNSLGLQPTKTKAYVAEELDKWSRLAIDGHVKKPRPWYSYHENLTAPMARIVGARTNEVVVMNTLSVNLHLLLVSFYRPTRTRFKILIEDTAFPSDRYAVQSQARFHAKAQGFNADAAVLAVPMSEMEGALEAHGHEIATVLIGTSNFLTGEVPDIAKLTELAHARGAFFGLDLAHGAGSVNLSLHDWNVDFAAWCSYKYLNGGPGALGGVFIHSQHLGHADIPRFEGWWGHDKIRRFEFSPVFSPMPTAEAWQLSNPPILQMAALRASLELFDKVGIRKIVKTTQDLVTYLEKQVSKLPDGFCEVVTPSDPRRRGGHLSLRFPLGRGPKVEAALAREGVWVDFRAPDIIRIACPGLYVTKADIDALIKILLRISKK